MGVDKAEKATSDGVKPTKVEYDCGTDIYGRRVRLVYDRDYAGRRAFTIQVDPYSQRDDGHRILHCLTRDNLIEMAKAAENHK